MILFEYDTGFPLPEDWDEEKVRKWLEECIRKFQVKVNSLIYTFLDDEQMQTVNLQIFDRDYLTDTITLSYETEGVYDGEIYISLSRVRENTAQYGSGYLKELLRVIIHSFLHTIGYGDQTEDEKKAMHCLENECLKYYERL